MVKALDARLEKGDDQRACTSVVMDDVVESSARAGL